MTYFLALYEGITTRQRTVVRRFRPAADHEFERLVECAKTKDEVDK